MLIFYIFLIAAFLCGNRSKQKTDINAASHVIAKAAYKAEYKLIDIAIHVYYNRNVVHSNKWNIDDCDKCFCFFTMYL